MSLRNPQHALHGLSTDLRDAGRAIAAARSHHAWVIVSLAIGMASTVAALALLNAALALPFAGVHDQAHLVRVALHGTCGRGDCLRRLASPADYDIIRGGLAGIETISAYEEADVAARLPEARNLRAMFTSANYFEVLGVDLIRGHQFSTVDEQQRSAVAVIAHAFWVDALASDPGVVGRTLAVGRRQVRIIGVAPPMFRGIDRTRPGARAPDIWLPLWIDDVQPESLSFAGRLAPGADLRAVQASAAVVAGRLARERAGEDAEGRADVRHVWRVNPENWQFAIAIVMPIPVLVLALACVNAANLLLARGTMRQRELAIRLALGASRARLVRLLLIESAIAAAAATAIAVPAAAWALRLASNPLGTPVPMNGAVLMLTTLAAVLTTLGFGLGPALIVSATRPARAMASGAGRGDARPGQSRLRQVLLTVQVVVSVGLLTAAWQLVATVQSQAVSGGTPGDRLLIARFDLRSAGLTGPAQRDFFERLAAGAATLPDVRAVGLARASAVWSFGQGAAAALHVRADGAPPERTQSIVGGYAGGDLMDAVGMRLVAGRRFAEADRGAPPLVAMVNTTFARAMATPPIGSILHVSPSGSTAAPLALRIVGVVEAVNEPRLSPGGTPPPRIYLPSAIEPEPALALYVRTGRAAAEAAQPLRELVAGIDPTVPVLDARTLDDINESSYAAQLWLARGGAVLGAIGLLLAAAGLYAMTSFLVAARARELAIRVAVGAAPGAVVRAVVAPSLRTVLVGLTVGGGAALVIGRVLQAGYHGIVELHAAPFAAAALLFVTVMLAAALVPARRASRVDVARLLAEP